MFKTPMSWGLEKDKTRSLQVKSRVGACAGELGFFGWSTDWRSLLGIWFTCATARRRFGGMTRLASRHDVIQLIRRQGFEFHQRICHGVQLVDVIGQQFFRRVVAVIDDLPHLFVDGKAVSVSGPWASHRQTYQGILRRHPRRTSGAPASRQTPLGHHASCQMGGSLDVIGRTRRDMINAQRNLFRDSAPKKARDLRSNALGAHVVAVFLGQEHGDTQGSASRNDGDLVDRVMVWHQPSDNGVSGFVIGGVTLFFF